MNTKITFITVIAVFSISLLARPDFTEPYEDFSTNVFSFGKDQLLPYIGVIKTIVDQKELLSYSLLVNRSLVNRENNLIHFYFYNPYRSDMLGIIFTDVEYQGSIKIHSVHQTAVITIAVNSAFNLNEPIFKPIMFPWDYYLKEKNIYLDYKFDFADSLKDFFINKFDVRVFYFY